MLKLSVGTIEFFNEETEEFEYQEPIEVSFEHSLISLSKWESIHNTPFLSDSPKTSEQLADYIRCMVVDAPEGVDVVERMTPTDFAEVQEYMQSPASATTFGTMPERRGRGETITSELIYYWLVAFNIPFECEGWHLNRLFALVKICNIKQEKPKKRSPGEIARQNRELNAQRKAQLGTSG